VPLRKWSIQTILVEIVFIAMDSTRNISRFPCALRNTGVSCFKSGVTGPYYAERSDTWRSNFLFKSFPRSTSAANQDKSREWNVSKQKWNMCHLKYQLDIWRKNTRSCQVGPRQVLRTTMNIHFLKI